MIKTLNDIMNTTGSDKASWAHGYCEAYEKHLGYLKEQKMVLLELGIGGEDKELGGASLKGWEQYFTNSRICGIDIFPKGALDTDRISTFTGSQADSSFLKNILAMTGTPTVIIDDASHINEYTIKSFQLLFPLLQSGGWYIIEDLSCAYRWDFGGVADVKNFSHPTIMNYLFSMLHNVNPVHIGIDGYETVKEFIDVESVHFYPDIVFIKKK